MSLRGEGLGEVESVPGDSAYRALGILLLGLLFCVAAQSAAANSLRASDQLFEALPGEVLPVADYLLSTPQIKDPLMPLAGLASADDGIEVHAALITVADPRETFLGRAFDIQVASVIRGFHARGYVLDSFALTWERPAQDGARIPVEGTRGYDVRHRGVPSVLVFRLDDWREGKAEQDGDQAGAVYSVVFLVGESPTFGLQNDAFVTAAACVTTLDGLRLRAGEPSDFFGKRCDARSSLSERAGNNRGLEVIGPAFSGSMQSLALAIGRHAEALAEAQRGGEAYVNVVSPSATVASNVEVKDWAALMATGVKITGYKAEGASLAEQLETLCIRVAEHVREAGGARGWRHGRSDGQIVFFVEESTFGSGIQPLIRDWRNNHPNEVVRDCMLRIRVTQFPQNVAAIRAERTRLDQAEGAKLRNMLKSRGDLLELDISGVDESSDRPPAYHRELSSRSDELMLYGTFDALRVWVKPAIVAIVATDVRDRLFLLNEVRKNLPTALPVLMEMDFLTAHPDYRKISRGAVVIPNGETLIKINRNTRAVTRCVGVPEVDYYAFPSDYAANMFRAVLDLQDRQSGVVRRPESKASCRADACLAAFWRTENCDLATCLAGGQGERTCGVSARNLFPERDRTAPYVTTLAGFQRFTDEKIRSRLLAADSRLTLEFPVYALIFAVGLAFVAVAAWLFLFGHDHLVMVSALRNMNPSKGIRENPDGRPETAPTEDRHPDAAALEETLPANVTFPAIGSKANALTLLAAGVAITALGGAALWGFFSDEAFRREWQLPHGRDVTTLYALLIIYVGVALVGTWRLVLWRRRYRFFMGEADGGQSVAALGPGIGHDGRGGVGVFAALAIFALFIVSVVVRGEPVSVDAARPSLLASLFLLPVGAWFVFEFWTQAKRWSRFAMLCGRTMDCVSKAPQRPGCRTDEGVWPSPLLLGELPQSPFSLQFRKRDLDSFCEIPSDLAWARQTRALSKGRWPFADDDGFERWQSRLVAEMRYAAVAVRSAAWCGILAPTAVLLGIGAYPPVNERLQTSAAVALVVAGFLLVMYVVLRLERHPLLSRMFTQHGDRLTISGAVGALWPKVIAATVVLVPVLFPDFLEWVYSLLRSIDSLQ